MELMRNRYGYRLKPNNQLHYKDPTGYWYQLDDTIRQRFPTAKAVYFDAHHPLSTSTHLRFSKALRSYVVSQSRYLAAIEGGEQNPDEKVEMLANVFDGKPDTYPLSR